MKMFQAGLGACAGLGVVTCIGHPIPLQYQMCMLCELSHAGVFSLLQQLIRSPNGGVQMSMTVYVYLKSLICIISVFKIRPSNRVIYREKQEISTHGLEKATLSHKLL